MDSCKTIEFPRVDNTWNTHWHSYGSWVILWCAEPIRKSFAQCSPETIKNKSSMANVFPLYAVMLRRRGTRYFSQPLVSGPLWFSIGLPDGGFFFSRQFSPRRPLGLERRGAPYRVARWPQFLHSPQTFRHFCPKKCPLKAPSFIPVRATRKFYWFSSLDIFHQ